LKTIDYFIRVYSNIHIIDDLLKILKYKRQEWGMTEPQIKKCTTCGVKLGGENTQCFTCRNKEEAKDQNRENNEPFFGDTLWEKLQTIFGLGFLLIAAVAVIGGIFGAISGPSHDEQYYAGLNSNVRIELIRHCQEEAKKDLNYPNTANFPFLTKRTDVRQVQDGQYELIISSDYTAKNAFGVEQNFWYYCESKYDAYKNQNTITLFNNYDG